MDVTFGLCVLLTIYVVFCYVRQCMGEGFVSSQAAKLSDKLVELFKNNSHVNYSLFKREIPGADPVKHADALRLHRENQINPQTVQDFLL